MKLEKQYKYFIKEVVIENEELKLACKEFYERVIGKKMKKETKELVKWIKEQLDFIKNEANKCELRSASYFDQFNKAVDFLNSLPEIESHLCRGGYIQDRNGTPCCDGDKVRFKFVEKWYKDNFKKKYTPVMDGILKFCGDTKKFYIQFGPYRNGYDWLDWSCEDDGCEWFEKVE